MAAFEITFIERLAGIERRDFATCFPGEIEDYDYHAAVEAAALDGFELGWFQARRGETVVGLVPVFFVDYDLTTTASGRLQMLARRAKPYIPGHLTLRLACLGSPVTERCPIGMHPGLSAEEASEVFGAILSMWEKQASACGIGLLGIKDISSVDCARFAPVLQRFGLKRMSGQTTASMAIPFRDLGAYIGSLSHATRKDIRRKMKVRTSVRVELRTDAGSHLDAIMRMYGETRQRADMSFETLTPGYFSEVLQRMPERALLALYFHEDALVGANLLLVGNSRLVDKYFVMHTGIGRQFNLYFLSWLTNVELCIERGLGTYISGQGAEATKRRLGCRLDATWVYFKHQNPVFNSILAAVSPHLAVKSPGLEVVS